MFEQAQEVSAQESGTYKKMSDRLRAPGEMAAIALSEKNITARFCQGRAANLIVGITKQQCAIAKKILSVMRLC